MCYRIKILIFSGILTLFSCDEDSGTGTVISNDVLITVVNQEGEDLLDPSNPESINIEEIKVFYLLNGIKTEINRSNLDYPKMFLVTDPDMNSEYYRILLFLNIEDDSEITTTYIELKPNIVYEFRSELNRFGNSVTDEKIWLQNELICDVNVNRGRCSTTIMIAE